jgi:hypothetical protein
MHLRRYFSIFWTNEPWKLNKNEKKIHILMNILLGIPILYIMYQIFTNLLKIHYMSFYFALCFFLVAWILYVYFWDKLNLKYGLKPVRSPFPYSYSGYVILFTLSSPGFFFMMLSGGLESGNFWFGLGLGVAVVYPICVMFLRIKTFSDRSIPVGGGFGFMPLSYWILSVALGFFTVVRGFSGLNFYLSDGSVSLEFVAISIIIGVVVQSVVLFPDKLNKVVPFDLRTKKGFIFMIVLAFILFGLSQFLIDFIKVLIS